jgi:D-3-phosphoglycerate dehydrogenase
MTVPDFLILDFDSTLIKGETFEILAKLSLQGNPKKETLLREIKETTEAAMSGNLDFAQALKKRLSLLNLHEKHVVQAIEEAKRLITPSFLKHKKFLTQYADRIYIVSGGFRELITPIVQFLGLREDHVYANEFFFNLTRNVVGIDESNPLSQSRGKSKCVKSLKLKGQGLILGDGATDAEIAEDNPHCTFYAFTEYARRTEPVKRAKREIKSLDDLLKEFGEDIKKEEAPDLRVLLLENVHPIAVDLFQEKGFVVETLSSACSESDLIKRIPEIHFLGIRSKTQISDKVLAHAKNLMSVGAFCIGTDQIQLDEAANKGVVVFNAPFSSTRSVVELAAGLIIMLSRQIFPKSQLLHQGIWDKSTTSACEVRGKTLGIIGYGNIGAQLSILAESLGMHVVYYDLIERISLGNAQRFKDLKSLLNQSDIVTLHIDGRSENTGFFNESAFSEMKEGSLFLNLSRGHVVDLHALSKVLKSGKIKGAALDVYPQEPRSNDERFVLELQNMNNVILTPHIGGSTLEAQKNIGETVVQRFLEYFDYGSSLGSVNFPQLSIPALRSGLTRIFHIHENVPGILAAINGFFGKWNINIEAQYLSTHNNIGYVVTDVSQFKSDLFSELSKVPHTIRVRTQRL